MLHEIALKGNHHDAAFAPDGNLLAVVGFHWPNGEKADAEDVLWLIDTAARKLVRTVGLPGDRRGSTGRSSPGLRWATTCGCGTRRRASRGSSCSATGSWAASGGSGSPRTAVA